MNSIWAELSCEVPTAMVDLLAEFLIETSGNGVSIENLEVDTFSLDSLEESPSKTIKAFFPCDNSLEANIAAVDRFIVANGPNFADFVYKPPRLTTINNEDWANNWKKHFKPVRIGKNLVIKPTWEEYQNDGDDLVLEIDPGMAFGTGAHPTTSMCLEVLERIFCLMPPFNNTSAVKPATVLDVGTGSGVLSIGAAKLGAKTIVAIDIDPEAVKVTVENLELNHVEERVAASTTPLAKISGTFDIVVANILAEELVRLAAELFHRVNPGGWLILSGILNEKETLVNNGFSSFNLTLLDTRQEAEWSCLTYRRES
jgi:ribosomal protein L11 methyltransferase